MLKRSVNEENRPVINMYVFTKRLSKYMKQKLTEQ